MFSATWPNVIRKLASEFLSNPARVIIGSQDLAASHSVKQVHVLMCLEWKGRKGVGLKCCVSMEAGCLACAQRPSAAASLAVLDKLLSSAVASM